MAEPLDPKLEEIIDQALRDHAREKRVSEHPSVDALVDFQEGLLSEQEVAAVRAHLDACRECSEDLERLGTWDPAAPVDEGLLPSAAEIADARRVFEQRLAAETETAPAVSAQVVPLRRRRRPGLYRLPLAAAALLATLVVGIWLGTLGGGAPEPRAVTADAPLFHSLRALDDATRRSAGEEIRWPPEFDVLVLRLLLGDVAPHGSYRAEIRDEIDEVRYRRADLPRQPNGSFLLTLPRGRLAAGSYTVRLLARDGDDETLLATFTFVLSPVPPEP